LLQGLRIRDAALLQEAPGPPCFALCRKHACYSSIIYTTILQLTMILSFFFFFMVAHRVQELGASPNVMSEVPPGQEELRMYPLHLAMQAKNEECVDLLMKHERVRLDVQDSAGKTPLHVAAGSGYIWGVRRLLEANADPATMDKNQRSVLQYAKEKGQKDCVRAIEEHIAANDQQAVAVVQARESPFAPFLPQGDETTPRSKGLSLVVVIIPAAFVLSDRYHGCERFQV